MVAANHFAANLQEKSGLFLCLLCHWVIEDRRKITPSPLILEQTQSFQPPAVCGKGSEKS